MNGKKASRPCRDASGVDKYSFLYCFQNHFSWKLNSVQLAPLKLVIETSTKHNLLCLKDKWNDKMKGSIKSLSVGPERVNEKKYLIFELVIKTSNEHKPERVNGMIFDI